MPERPDVDQQLIIPSQNSQIGSENAGYTNGKCGDSWAHSFVINRPNNGRIEPANEFELPALGDPADLPITDANIDRRSALLEECVETANDVLSDVSEYSQYLSSSERASVKKLAERGKSYAKKAIQLWDYWEISWVTTDWPGGAGSDIGINGAERGGHMYTKSSEYPGGKWPLSQSRPFYGACKSEQAGQTVKIHPQFGNSFNVKCPGGQKPTYTIHANDKDRFIALVRAAVLNVRCAQETLATLVSYGMNKMPGLNPVQGKKQFQKVGVMGTKPRRATAGEVDPPPEEVVEEEVEVVPEPTKKASNMPIIAAAAALGVLMLSKRR